jgi:hypothetical protein
MALELAIKPLLSLPKTSGWSQTAILSNAPQQMSPETQPIWVIALSGIDAAVAEPGIKLLHKIEKTYHNIELKTPAALYQLLSSNSIASANISVSAAVITEHTITLIGRGTFQAVVIKDGKAHSLLTGVDQSDWQAIEGTWLPTDVWWSNAGEALSKDLEKHLFKPSHAQHLNQLYIDYQMPELPRSGILFYADKSVAKPTSPSPLTKISQKLSFLTSNAPDAHTIKRRRIMLVGWAILLMLAISVWFGAKARTNRQLSESYTSLETSITQLIAKAQTEKEFDQVVARDTLRQGLSQLEAAKPAFESHPDWLAKWEQLNQTYQQQYQTISGEIEIAQLPLWYSLNLIKPEMTGTSIQTATQSIVVWDAVTKTLATIDIDNKSHEIAAGGDAFTNATSLTVSGPRALMRTVTGITDISLTQKTTTTIIEPDSEWLQPQGLSLYNGSIYIADPAAGALWRYPAVNSGVGAKQSWLGPGVELPSSIKSMVIDSDVWILSGDSRILRYRRGAQLPFTISGIDTPLGQNTPAISVHPELDFIAILDADNQRLVITDKTGAYIKQYAWSGFAQTQDITFAPDSDQIFILNPGSIYVTSEETTPNSLPQ